MVKHCCPESIMCLKLDQSCRLLHGHGRGSHLNEIIFPILTRRIVLSNKKRNLRKYSVVFFKAFSKKKVFDGPTICLKDSIFPFYVEYNAVQISATALLGATHTKCSISHNSCAYDSLNSSEGMGYVGLKDPQESRSISMLSLHHCHLSPQCSQLAYAKFSLCSVSWFL